MINHSNFTLTHQVRSCEGRKDAVMWSITYSEKLKAQEGMCDSFVDFAEKIRTLGLAVNSPFTAIADLGVKFNGSVYNLTMHKTIGSLQLLWTADLTKVLRELDIEFGKELLSNSYNKLWKFFSLVQKADFDKSPGSRFHQGLAVWLLRLLQLDCRLKLIQPKSFSLEAIDKNKHGVPGFVQIAFLKHQAWQGTFIIS
jgi:hypothetical protein